MNEDKELDEDSSHQFAMAKEILSGVGMVIVLLKIAQLIFTQ